MSVTARLMEEALRAATQLARRVRYVPLMHFWLLTGVYGLTAVTNSGANWLKSEVDALTPLLREMFEYFACVRENINS